MSEMEVTEGANDGSNDLSKFYNNNVPFTFSPID